MSSIFLQANDRFRWKFLSLAPHVKEFLRSDFWPKGLNYNFTAYAYPVYLALLIWGPQDRDHNFGLNLFWAYWWPLMFIIYPLLGRVWCSGIEFEPV